MSSVTSLNALPLGSVPKMLDTIDRGICQINASATANSALAVASHTALLELDQVALSGANPDVTRKDDVQKQYTTSASEPGQAEIGDTAREPRAKETPS